MQPERADRQGRRGHDAITVAFGSDPGERFGNRSE